VKERNSGPLASVKALEVHVSGYIQCVEGGKRNSQNESSTIRGVDEASQYPFRRIRRVRLGETSSQCRILKMQRVQM
jgi:hypothetical protein